MAAPEDGWAPRTDVAALVGVSVSALRRWIEAGDVRAERRASVWFVNVEDAEKRAGKSDGDEPPGGGGSADPRGGVGSAHLGALGRADPIDRRERRPTESCGCASHGGSKAGEKWERERHAGRGRLHALTRPSRNHAPTAHRRYRNS